MNANGKSLIVGIPGETFPGERRVSLIPATIPGLKKAGLEVIVESGAGNPAGFPDAEYEGKGVRIASSREEVFKESDIIVQVRSLGANPVAGRKDLDLMRQGQLVIGMCEPLSELESVEQLRDRGVTLFAMELIPRITRAQSMDTLSSMATVAGYKAVLMAADNLPRMFPMFMTAAGTIAPAKVFVVGAGVAGLQAISTAKRLGAVVHAYDIRPVVKEQVESLGAKFVELELEQEGAEDSGGYAKEMNEDFYRKQREMMTRVIAESHVVITTAAVPGKKAPLLVTKEMVAGMKAGSVIVDLAAERGGNCELTKPDEIVVENGVKILGPANLPSSIPYHASQMYSKNISTFLLHLMKDGTLHLDREDEITKDTLVAQDGEIVHAGVRELINRPEKI